MSRQQEETDEFFENSRQHLNQVDDVVHVVLNAHLDVEQTLDSFLTVVFFHPEYFRKCNLHYFDKVQIARAYSELLHEMPEWSLMLALGGLRNAIAHGDKGKKRADRIDDLRNKLSNVGSIQSQQRIRNVDDKEAVVYAAAICSGFLCTIERELWEIRHPDEEWPGNEVVG